MLTVSLQAMHLLIAVLAVNMMSLLDAISTFLLLDTDRFLEINPLMEALMESGSLHFFGVKLGITLVGTLICWHFYEQRSSARWALKFTLRAYCTLMLWQGLLLTGLVR